MNRYFGILTGAVAFGIVAPIAAQATQITFNVPVTLTRVALGPLGRPTGFSVNCLPFNVNPATNGGAQLGNYSVVQAGNFSLDATNSFSGTVTEVINSSTPAHGYQCSIGAPPGSPPIAVTPVSGSM
jgi:hypothetical protein